MSAANMKSFSDPVREWFETTFQAPTPVQRRGWPRLARGENALLIAPTGSGKTLAAFLWSLDQVTRSVAAGDSEDDEPKGVRVLYVSPLKALVYDIERNLRAPLVGIQHAARRLGQASRNVGVDIRTGDTPAADRRRQLRNPAEILVTTPESLYLLLGSQAAATLQTVETVIVDEIHALAPSKRGVHLALSLERLSQLTDREPQRVGLSATVEPPSEAARFLGGDREVSIVDASEPANVDLEIVVPVADMENTGTPQAALEQAQALAGPILSADESLPATSQTPRPALEESQPASWTRGGETSGMWPVIYPRLLDLVEQHRSTIVFVNSRGLCERLAQRLNDLWDEREGGGEDADGEGDGAPPRVRAHHGSISHSKRAEIEEAMKLGTLRCIVATSSLELGIDMGAVDLVILVESPGSVSSGLQRVGRAGHQVGEKSRGVFFPKFRGDLLECAVIAQEMRKGTIEPIQIPQSALDVLAQQIVAMCSLTERPVEEVYQLVQRAYPFRDLSKDVFFSVLDMVTGRFPSEEFADLRPRLNWDRARDVLIPRRGSQMISILNGGTIPDRGLYSVHLGSDGPRLGELDEEMVYESRPGDTFLLGASTWRVLEITRDRVIVAPAPGEPGRMPFWHGEGPGRPIGLGRALGAFQRELAQRSTEDARQWLAETTPLDELAVGNLLQYIDDQVEHTGVLPSDRAITIERFRDEIGDWRVCLLSPFGSRVHGPWAMALERMLGQEAGFDVQTMYSDDGIVMRFADVDQLPQAEDLIPDPDTVEDLIVEQVGSSALFASAFREAAARALLLPRNRPGRRTALWQQRLRSKNLMGVVQRFPSFPILLETYRHCLRDVFDVPALVDLLRRIRSRQIRVDDVETPSASPFARSLVFAYVANYLYDQDSPAAERRAQALTLDRGLLRELLGQTELRDLLDAEVIEEIEAELQGLAPSRRARDADGLADLLRRVGDLSLEELHPRCESAPKPWLEELEAQRRVARVRFGDEERVIATEDAARYRDALGVPLPMGLPGIFLESVESPLEDLVRRYARSRGPFLTRDVAVRMGLLPAQVEPVLLDLRRRGRLERGEIRPHGRGQEWCDPEVLRRIRRRTLAKLRRDVEAVDAAALARFLPEWTSVARSGESGRRGASPVALEETLAQLEGLALSWRALSTEVLPARLDDFRPEMLDTLAATGEIVWTGAGALGPNDGRLRLLRRDRAELLLRPSDDVDGQLAELANREVAQRVLETLEERGACFTSELVRRCVNEATLDAEVEAAIWDLVWLGLVTNDTLLPLQSLGRIRRSATSTAAASGSSLADRHPYLSRGGRGAHASRGRARRPARGRGSRKMSGGRWSLVRDLIETPATDTEWAHAWAVTLLERYGIVSREMALAEGVPGGFEAIYPVLREMEESGRVRRGYFVEGLSGRQFALAGAVDRLRDARREDQEREALVLPATDPANPYGALLPWPKTTNADGPRPRRVAGAALALVAGQPRVYLEAGGRSAITFAALAEGGDIERAWKALATAPRRVRRRRQLTKIDGVPALESKLESVLLAAGFARDFEGYRFPGTARASVHAGG